MSDIQPKYLVHNTTRDRVTRTLRAQNVRDSGVLQLNGGTLRVVRGRPVQISNEIFESIREELLAQEKVGRLRVTDLRGCKVNLETLEVAETNIVTQPEVYAPAPNFLPDSAERDSPHVGEYRPLHGDPNAPTVNDDPETPSLIQEGSDEEEAPTPTVLYDDQSEPVVGEPSALYEGAPVEEPPAEVVEEPVATEEAPTTSSGNSGKKNKKGH